jgi:hypothetical protein
MANSGHPKMGTLQKNQMKVLLKNTFFSNDSRSLSLITEHCNVSGSTIVYSMCANLSSLCPSLVLQIIYWRSIYNPNLCAFLRVNISSECLHNALLNIGCNRSDPVTCYQIIKCIDIILTVLTNIKIERIA